MRKSKILLIVFYSCLFLFHCSTTEEEFDEYAEGELGEFSDVSSVDSNVSEGGEGTDDFSDEFSEPNQNDGQTALSENEVKDNEGTELTSSSEEAQMNAQPEKEKKEDDPALSETAQQMQTEQAEDESWMKEFDQDSNTVTQEQSQIDTPLVENQSPSNAVTQEKYQAIQPLSPNPEEKGGLEGPAKQIRTESKSPNVITDLQFRSNDMGGTFVIQAKEPIIFSQSYHEKINQLIIDLEDIIIPRQFQRPFNTKDFPGTIGFIDIFKPRGSNKGRVIVQLRPGSPIPVIHSEGSSLFVIAQNAQPQLTNVVPHDASDLLATGTQSANEKDNTKLPSQPEAYEKASGDLSKGNKISDSQEDGRFSHGIESLFNTNRSYSGKKISIEIDDMDIKTLFRLLSEETGINFIIPDEIGGKISLRLKSVPWDELMMMVLRAKKLGYTRSGNIIRIAPLSEIKEEAEQALKLEEAQRLKKPLIVKSIPINYAKIDELERKIDKFLTPNRGTMFADVRTSTLVISDIEDVINRVEALIKTIDVPPQQVLIESRIVEASDDVEKEFGIRWILSGAGVNLGSNTRLSATSNFSAGADSAFRLNFSLGTINFLGNLTAFFSYLERENKIRVISSPRVLTLHNQKAEITESTEIPLITSMLNPNSNIITSNVQFKSAQMRLEVTPQVTNDAHLLLDVSISREVPGSIVEQGSKARPVNARSAKTRVLLQNGQTAVIGGIYQNDMTEGATRVPGISKWPIIGGLFGSEQSTQKRNELLIFLTPRIVGRYQNSFSAAAGSNVQNMNPAKSSQNVSKESNSSPSENELQNEQPYDIIPNKVNGGVSENNLDLDEEFAEDNKGMDWKTSQDELKDDGNSSEGY
ncbi:MAG: type IV pilus secretin PilQ [Pseudobdellovibrionaceae bacterium]|nr:type IV pilus secretin PilQ [Pseudobdellovibrionaceae bacterium]